MTRLVEDPALVEHLGQHGRAAAARYARGPSIEKVIEVYKRAR